MRRSNISLSVGGLFGWSYHQPPQPFPKEYVFRVATDIKLTPKRDPKNKWGRHNFDMGAAHPNHLTGAGDNNNFGSDRSAVGTQNDIPPIPIYRQHIQCQGMSMRTGLNFHPKMNIKVKPGTTKYCKWCGLKYINMATVDDSDENWKAECEEIQLTPETMAELKRPFRSYLGELPRYSSNFQDEKEPHPDLYPTVYNPAAYFKKYANSGAATTSDFTLGGGEIEAASIKQATEEGKLPGKPKDLPKPKLATA